MAESALFWNLFAKQYSKQAIGNPEAYKHKLEFSRNYFTPESNALEIGCGTGTTALIHAPYLKHIRATDISPSMIKIAKGKAEEQNIKNVTFEEIAISKITTDEPLDIVFALSIIHLVDDKDELTRKIYDWLKPGGTFISSTVTFEGNSLWLLLLPLLGFTRILPKVKMFKQKELKQSFINAGFEVDYEWRPESVDSVFMVCKKPS